MHENEHILTKNKDTFNNEYKIKKKEIIDVVFDNHEILDNVFQYTLI